ncbi:Pumilio [Citrus sinensis]|nr:Pumilio [Citrus sinensis]
MSIWGNQDNLFDLASILEGGRRPDLNRGIGIANLSTSIGPGTYGKNALLAQPDYDIVLLGKTEGGSLFLQKMLSGKDSTITYKIFEAVYKYPFDLMTDGYGFSCLGSARSMQKLIKVLVGSPCISLVISAAYRRFKDMMFSKEASSVIIKCLETLDEQKNEVLYLAAMNHFRELATHVRGCVSLNNFINEMRGPRRGGLLDLISSHAEFLSKDPSGNYVVQHVLGLGDLKYSEKICSLLKGKFEELSLLRCGSHLVEKCLKSPGMAHYVHKYGNFVIQQALRVTKKLLNDDALKVGFGRHVFNLIATGISDD